MCIIQREKTINFLLFLYHHNASISPPTTTISSTNYYIAWQIKGWIFPYPFELPLLLVSKILVSLHLLDEMLHCLKDECIVIFAICILCAIIKCLHFTENCSVYIKNIMNCDHLCKITHRLLTKCNKFMFAC